MRSVRFTLQPTSVGPYFGTVSNVAPWLFTVAASTIDRDFASYVTLGDNKHFKGTSLSFKDLPTHKFYPLISGEEGKHFYALSRDAKFCRYGTLDVEKVRGKIVVCLEDVYFGTIPDAEASSAGAVGMILANDDENYYDFIAYPHALPTSQVNYIDSQYIYSYIKNEKYNFNKVAQYKQLTLEEAEEKMNNRKKTADGYQRWMMKATNNGPAAFGEHGKLDDKESKRSRKKTGDDDEGPSSDKGEEDEDEEVDRKSRHGLNKKSGYDDDDDEGPRGGDLDDDDYDVEKGDDWEHEEVFTDDDETLGNDPEEREDLDPEVPAPPEIKQ